MIAPVPSAAAKLGKAARADGVDGAAEHVFGSAVSEAGFSLEAVARAGRQVLQLESAGDSVAPGSRYRAVRMPGLPKHRKRQYGNTSVVFMSSGTEVQRTPGLIEAQVADDIRNVVTTRGVAQEVVGERAVGAVRTDGRRCSS